jgi:hypothetical protein
VDSSRGGRIAAVHADAGYRITDGPSLGSGAIIAG